ncbi:hypothetical protein MKW92_031008 [Papaver armeniacum]|nr:hypothetical protein MKW92_036188 [Papaver armeniacum]KAI3911894.1 hypothetical protein MKW92_031008 [Papaver armeniacum]
MTSLNYCKYSWTYGVWKWPSSASTSFTSSINTYAGSTKAYSAAAIEVWAGFLHQDQLCNKFRKLVC